MKARMTKTQERRSYRLAVEASLAAFYDVGAPEAARLVREWWKRLAGTEAFGTGLFLHAEPVNTAGSLANLPVVRIGKANRERYHRILDESRDLALGDAARGVERGREKSDGTGLQSSSIAKRRTATQVA